MSRSPLRTLSLNATCNRSRALNQRECQTVERSVYRLHFTERGQTTCSLVLVAGHCAALCQWKAGEKAFQDRPRWKRFFENVVLVVLCNKKEVKICRNYRTKAKMWEFMRFSETSLKHQKLCTFLNCTVMGLSIDCLLLQPLWLTESSECEAETLRFLLNYFYYFIDYVVSTFPSNKPLHCHCLFHSVAAVLKKTWS